MSKLFFDHLIKLKEVNIVIKNSSTSYEEREELWNLVDELVEQRVLSCIFSNLPKDNHEHFIEMFKVSPWDEEIITFINEKSGKEIEKEIESEIENLKKEILEEL